MPDGQRYIRRTAMLASYDASRQARTGSSRAGQMFEHQGNTAAAGTSSRWVNAQG